MYLKKALEKSQIERMCCSIDRNPTFWMGVGTEAQAKVARVERLVKDPGAKVARKAPKETGSLRGQAAWVAGTEKGS